MSDLVKRLRDPALMKRWWDQYGMEAADEIDRLERELAAMRLHFDAAYQAVGLSQFSSKPLSCAIQESIATARRDGMLEAARIAEDEQCDQTEYSCATIERIAAAIRAAAEQNAAPQGAAVPGQVPAGKSDGSVVANHGPAVAAPVFAPVGGGVIGRPCPKNRVPSGAEPVCPKCGAEELSNSVHGGFCQKCGRALDICICGREAK